MADCGWRKKRHVGYRIADGKEVVIILKKIIYTDHLTLRLKLRLIPYELPEDIYRNARERYFDCLTGHCVALKNV